MKKKRHSLETIMRILRQAEAEKSITAVCREHEITDQTLYRWRRKYDNMDLLDTKRLKALDLACERYGAPKCIRSDNGPELVATAVQDCVKSRQIDCIYVAPGSPWENGYVESFHSRFRNDCLNREWFINELDAKVAIGDWREHYNECRPHSGIDYQSPAEVFFGKCSASSWATPFLSQSTCQRHPEPLTTK